MQTDIAGTVMSKLESKIGLIGGALGFVNGPMVAYGGLNSEMLRGMQERITKWHIPNPAHIFTLMGNFPTEYPILETAMAAVGGWVMQEAGPIVDSRLGQVGRLIKKGSISFLVANIASAFVWLAFLNPTGLSGGAGTHGTGTSMNPYGTSPMWSGNPGGPGAPHATNTNGYASKISFERVAA